jgi:hypothetical protein
MERRLTSVLLVAVVPLFSLGAAHSSPTARRAASKTNSHPFTGQEGSSSARRCAFAAHAWD